jgi:Fe-S cluster assembly protein SufD
LHSLLEKAPWHTFDARLVPHAQRAASYQSYSLTPSGHERAGRYWKYNADSLAPSDLWLRAPAGAVEIESRGIRVVACDLQTALRDHAAHLSSSFRNAIEPTQKFAHLTVAFAQLGAFVYIPAGCNEEEPIVIRYRAGEGESCFPHTVVYAEHGSRATVIERVETGAGSFVCGVAEIVTGEGADLTYASVQGAADDARVLFTRAARPGKDARVTWATAELGAELSLSDISVAITQPGVEAAIATIFFPTGSQHVDIVSTIDHRAGDATSDTLVKSAAAGSGQGRYLGNIRIAAHAQHSVAALRDDALLLSPHAHIDSIPALEIAANDVRAYHGATVGALDDEQIFYMTSRGIEREAAERMIALGFFEPAIERFPTESLREELRERLQHKVVSP